MRSSRIDGIGSVVARATAACWSVFERWESQEALGVFLSGGPAFEQAAAAMLSASSAAEYDIADVRPPCGEGTA